MRIVCLGVANGISHTTSGAPTSSVCISDRVTGTPIGLVGVGGGVVRSIIQTLNGFDRLPTVVIILSPSVMSFVDLPVYLRIQALQKKITTVVAPAEILDRVVAYTEDVLAEEEASIALEVQKQTHFIEIELNTPTPLPLPKAGGDPSSGTDSSAATHHQSSGRRLKNIQSDFDDVVLSQWLLYTHRTPSPVREDLFRYNAVIIHRRVVIDGSSRYKHSAVPALLNAISTASTLEDATEVIKEDTTSIVGLVDHLPVDAEGLRMLQHCDLLLATLPAEGPLRRCFESAQKPHHSRAQSGVRKQQEHPDDSDDDAKSTSSAVSSKQSQKPPPEVHSPAVQQPNIVLYRYAAHEPPVTFHPSSYIAQVGITYSVSEGAQVSVIRPGHNATARSGASKKTKPPGHADPAEDRHTNTAAVRDQASPLPSQPSPAPLLEPLNAKQVVEVDLTDSFADSGDVPRTPSSQPLQDYANSRDAAEPQEGETSFGFFMAGGRQGGGGLQQQLQLPTRLAASVTMETIASLRQRKRQSLDEDLRQAPAKPPKGSSKSAAYDPETCPFASSLRAEHYDGDMSHLAEIRRQVIAARDRASGETSSRGRSPRQVSTSRVAKSPEQRRHVSSKRTIDSRTVQGRSSPRRHDGGSSLPITAAGFDMVVNCTFYNILDRYAQPLALQVELPSSAFAFHMFRIDPECAAVCASAFADVSHHAMTPRDRELLQTLVRFLRRLQFSEVQLRVANELMMCDSETVDAFVDFAQRRLERALEVVAATLLAVTESGSPSKRHNAANTSHRDAVGALHSALTDVSAAVPLVWQCPVGKDAKTLLESFDALVASAPAAGGDRRHVTVFVDVK